MITCVDSTAEQFPEFLDLKHYREVMQQLYAQAMGWA